MLEAETECLRSRPMLQDQSAKLGFGRCTHRTSKIGNIGACWNIGESASASCQCRCCQKQWCCCDHRTFTTTAVVGYHRTLQCSRLLFCALFPENCPSLFCWAQRVIEIRRHLIPRECTTTLPSSPMHLLPHSHDSVSTTVQLCGADFARRTCFWAGVVDHMHPSPPTNRAGRGDLNRT